MRLFYRIFSSLILVFSLLSTSGGLIAEDYDLDGILDQMDKAGDSLDSMQADITQKKWTDILAEFDAGESGRLMFLRSGEDLYFRKDINDPTQNTLVIKGGEVTFYQPGIKQAQQYQLGNNKDKAEFLLLGFGTDKEAIREVYDLELLGQEQLEGKEVYKLQMVPKSEKVSAFFVKIVLWIDPRIWVPVQQKLVEPTQDYLLISFEDIELNPKLKKSDFELNLPGDVKVIR